MTTQPQLMGVALAPSDIVYTPDWVARDMVAWFNPCGTVLEPCAGGNAIYKFLPEGSEWCEIDRGRDFFSYNKHVDWIVSNPPYSLFRAWLQHSLDIADNIVYLLSLSTFFTSYSRMSDIRDKGWVKHLRIYGTGTKLGFPTGRPMAAFHFVTGYRGDTSWSWYDNQKGSR